MSPSQSKKKRVLEALYAVCKERGNFVFSNEEVKQACARIGFGNPFDATKIDSSLLLPDALAADNAFVIHLGNGNHQFVFGIGAGYHRFETVPESSKRKWPYRRSILNNINTSESNILSVGINQRVIHDFLYQDITTSPKTYGSHRTKVPLSYRIGDDNIEVDKVQVEIDLTIEHQGKITIFEAKNGESPDFNVFQLFNPYRYYLQAIEESKMFSINCCYLLRQDDRLRLYLYAFDDDRNPGSIRLLRNAEYILVKR